MYCPSCDQKFENTLSRCPECHCWLKTQARAEKSSWLDGTDFQAPADGWTRPEEPGPTDGWSTGSSPTRGWTEEPDDQEFGWHYTEPTGPPDPKVEAHLDDGWVDDEFAYEDLEEHDYLPDGGVSTIRVSLEEEEKAWSSLRLLLVAALVMIVMGMAFFQNRGEPDAPTPAELARADNLESAEIWLASARDSSEKGLFEDAALQYKQAVAFLEDAGARREKLVPARVRYADALIESGDFLSAHEQLFKVAGDISDGEERLAWTEDALVQDATEELATARQLLGQEPAEAVNRAEDALEVFMTFNAGNAQIARAHDVIAQGHLQQNDVTAAAESVKDALRWESSPQRLSLYAQLFPSAPPPETRAKRQRRVKLQASLGDGSDVPKGTHGRRPRYKRPNKPVEVVSKPKERPPEHVPNYDKFRKKQEKRLGFNPLTDK